VAITVPVAAGTADPLQLAVAIGVAELDRVPPAVTVLVPAGGEDWTYGDLQTVRWQASDAAGVVAVDLHLSRDGGATFDQTLATGLANSGAWSGSLRGGPGDGLRLRVRAHDPTGNTGSAVSAPFALSDRYPPAVVLDGAPAGGTVLAPGAAVALAWQAADNVGVTGVVVELSCDGGATWEPTGLGSDPFAGVAAPSPGAPVSGAASWTVPDLPCGQAVLRAVALDAVGNAGTDASEAFAIRGTTTDASTPALDRLALGPCIPNPFNPRATIVYTLPAAGVVDLGVHDAAGRRLATLASGHRPAGRHEAVWDGRDRAGRPLASGVYWVRATGPGGAALLKITLVR